MIDPDVLQGILPRFQNLLHSGLINAVIEAKPVLKPSGLSLNQAAIANLILISVGIFQMPSSLDSRFHTDIQYIPSLVGVRKQDYYHALLSWKAIYRSKPRLEGMRCGQAHK